MNAASHLFGHEDSEGTQSDLVRRCTQLEARVVALEEVSRAEPSLAALLVEIVRQRDAARSELEAARAQVEAFALLRDESAARARNLDDRLRELQKRVASDKEHACQREQLLADAIMQRDEARSELLAARARVELLEATRDESTASIGCLSNEVSELLRQLASEQQQAARLRSEAACASEALAGAARQRDDAVRELEAARARADSLQATRADSAAYARFLDARVSELERQLDKEKAALAQHRRLAAAAQQRDAAAAAAAAAKAEADALKHKAARAADARRLAELERELERANATCNLLRRTPRTRADVAPEPEALRLSLIRQGIRSHLRRAADDAELGRRVRSLLMLWHPDKHRVLTELATVVTKLINHEREEAGARFSGAR